MRSLGNTLHGILNTALRSLPRRTLPTTFRQMGYPNKYTDKYHLPHFLRLNTK